MWPEREVNHARSVHSCYWSGDLQQKKTVHPLCFCLVVTSSLTNSCICPLIIGVICQCFLDVRSPFSSLMSVCCKWWVCEMWNPEYVSGMLCACIAFRLCGVMSPCTLRFGWGGLGLEMLIANSHWLTASHSFINKLLISVAFHSWLLTS